MPPPRRPHHARPLRKAKVSKVNGVDAMVTRPKVSGCEARPACALPAVLTMRRPWLPASLSPPSFLGAGGGGRHLDWWGEPRRPPRRRARETPWGLTSCARSRKQRAKEERGGREESCFVAPQVERIPKKRQGSHAFVRFPPPSLGLEGVAFAVRGAGGRVYWVRRRGALHRGAPRAPRPLCAPPPRPRPRRRPRRGSAGGGPY